MLTNNPDGFLSFDHIPPKWLPFIEAGMIRIRMEGTSWKLFHPNRFLIKIFNKKIKWFNWENIQDLLVNSATTKTLKGKVFEYLFALELLAMYNSSVWKRLRELMKIRPKVDWNPRIELIGNIDSHLDQNVVYVMIDPARKKSKTDVIFFAETIESHTSVRVLCTLTTQHDSTDNAKNSFIDMFKLDDDNIPDYRLFLSPQSNVNELMNFAVLFDDKELADKIGLFVPGSKKRKREFQSMKDFYDALNLSPNWVQSYTDIAKGIFDYQRIKRSQLVNLTDAKLKEYGLVQGGLRKAVLSVIENN